MSGLKFGVYQRIVYSNLKPTTLGGDECNALDVRLVIIEQFVCQAHGPVGVVSDYAVFDGNF